MITFVVFSYFGYSSVVASVAQIQSTGASQFFGNISANITYLEPLAGAVLAVLVLISAVLVAVEAQSSYRLSLVSGLLTVAFFSYMYLNTGAIYMLAVVLLSFFGLVTLSYSRVVTIPEEEQLEIGTPSQLVES